MARTPGSAGRRRSGSSCSAREVGRTLVVWPHGARRVQAAQIGPVRPTPAASVRARNEVRWPIPRRSRGPATATRTWRASAARTPRWTTERLHASSTSNSPHLTSTAVGVRDRARRAPAPVPCRYSLRAVHEALHGRAGRSRCWSPWERTRRCPTRRSTGHLGRRPAGLAAALSGLDVRNHAWRDPTTFVELGTIGAARVGELSGGRLDTKPSPSGSTVRSSSTT